MPRKSYLPNEVHRTSARLADGRLKFYFALRGRKGTGFWSDFDPHPRNASFHAAYLVVIQNVKPKQNVVKTADVVTDFYASTKFKTRKPRTQADYRRWLDRFVSEFGDDPIEMWETKETRREIEKWRKKWDYSPKQYDYAGSVVMMFLNWAETEIYIERHFWKKFEKLYDPDRSDIVWTSDHVAKVESISPEWVRRLLVAATETGLRAGDLIKLNRGHIENTDSGRRIRIKTNKRGIEAYVPVSDRMGRLIDETPKDRLLILSNASGAQLTTHRASEGLRQWRDKAGLDPDSLGYELRLNDARGTAATRLLRAGLSLSQIAACMGWSLRTASAMIERYAKVSPEESDEVNRLLKAARRNA